MRRLLAAVGLALALPGLAACGRAPVSKPSARLKVLPVHIAVPNGISLLPLWVAQATGVWSQAGYRVVPVARASLTIGPAGQWPLLGVVAWRPEWCIVTRLPMEFFRWRDLAHIPVLPVSGVPADARPVVQAILTEHGVDGVTWDFLAPTDAVRLFEQGRLPWLLAPLVLAEDLTLHHQGYLAAFVGAATGPMPALVVAGHGAGAVTLLAGLNQALMETEELPASRLAHILHAHMRAVPTAVLAAAVNTARGLSLWPPTVYPDTATFTAGQQLMQSVGIEWPPYSAAVDSGPARRAFVPASP